MRRKHKPKVSLKKQLRTCKKELATKGDQFISSSVSMLIQHNQRDKSLWAELADRLGVEWENEQGFSKQIPELFQAILDKYEVKKP